MADWKPRQSQDIMGLRGGSDRWRSGIDEVSYIGYAGGECMAYSGVGGG